jgi:hypothetical protein
VWLLPLPVPRGMRPVTRPPWPDDCRTESAWLQVSRRTSVRDRRGTGPYSDTWSQADEEPRQAWNRVSRKREVCPMQGRVEAQDSLDLAYLDHRVGLDVLLAVAPVIGHGPREQVDVVAYYTGPP